MQIRNFLFHRVSDEKDEFWPPMRVSLFENVIRYLKIKYQVVLLEDILEHPEQFKLTAKKIATIQFDDGYKDNIENAVPVLKKYNCPASFYIVSDCIDSGIPTWTYLLDHALQYTRVKKLELPFDFVPVEKRTISLEASNNPLQSVHWIKPWLKKVSNTRRVTVVNSILDQCADVTTKRADMMNWADINELMREGFHIGSHSKSHPLLAAIETEQEIFDELSMSAERIEQLTGKRPVTISYPIGSFDDRVIRLANESGYKYGLAVEHKFFKMKEHSVMSIPRVELYQEPIWKVYLRVNGRINLFKKNA